MSQHDSENSLSSQSDRSAEDQYSMPTIDANAQVDDQLFILSSQKTQAISFFERTIDGIESSEIDKISSGYQALWKGDGKPCLDTFISSLDASSIDERLIYKLVGIDLQERQSRGIPIADADYFAQLSNYQRAVEAAILKFRYSTLSPQSGDSRAEKEMSNLWRRLQAPGSERFHVLDMFAKGGLGAVYRAKDLELGRQVALKQMLPTQSEDFQNRQRFVFEAEVTGRLEHPGIVPVYGFGMTKKGEPYYAMRFIDGSSMAEAIKSLHHPAPNPNPSAKAKRAKATSNQPRSSASSSRHPIDYYGGPFRNLLRRVIDVCNAIEFAHAHSVLHRDLKPENVMLGRYGETLVVDWGLARILNARDDNLTESAVARSKLVSQDSHSTETSHGSTLGTPMFMSPEQATGRHEDLTPASDVYSLGAMLFVLLSGELPLPGNRMSEVLANAQKGNQKKLADVAPAAPKPLQSVCRKAMEFDKSKRYQSAGELAADLENWLNDEIVQAHAPVESQTEKWGRWLRKHRSWAASGALALTAITMIAIAATFFVDQARRSEQSARVTARDAKQEALDQLKFSIAAIDTSLTQTSDRVSVLSLYPKLDNVRRNLLGVAKNEYEKLLVNATDDAAMEYHRAGIAIRLGTISEELNEYNDALRFYQRAETILNNVGSYSTQNDIMPDLVLLARLEAIRARMRVALIHGTSSKLELVEELEPMVVDLRTVVSESSHPTAKRYLAEALFSLGEACETNLKYDDAEAYYREVVDALGQVNPSDANDRINLATAMERISDIEQRRGKADEAIELLSAAHDVLEPIAEAEANAWQWRAVSDIANLRQRESDLLQATDRLDLALVSIEDAIESYNILWTKFQGPPRIDLNLARAYQVQSSVLLAQDRSNDAIASINSAFDLLTRINKIDWEQSEESTDLDRFLLQIASLDLAGQAAMQMGDDEDAKLALQDAIFALKERLTQQKSKRDVHVLNHQLAIVYAHYGDLMTQNGSPETLDLASRNLPESIKILNRLRQEDEATNRYASDLGNVYTHLGNYRLLVNDMTAADAFQLAQEEWESMGESRDPVTTERLAWMLTTCPLDEIRDFELAVNYGTEALAQASDNRRLRCTTALALSLQQDFDKASAVLELDSIDDRDAGGRELLTAAIVATGLNRLEEAERFWTEGQAWVQEQAPFSKELRLLLQLSSLQSENTSTAN